MPSKRGPREGANARQAWADYRDMPEVERSLDRLLAQYRARTDPVPTRSRSTIRRWSGLYGWQLRLEHIHNEAMARGSQARIEELARRRTEHTEALWGASQRLFARAQAMESFPLEQRTLIEDGHTTIINPIRWSAVDIVRSYEAADRLARVALELPVGDSPLDVDAVIKDLLDREGITEPELRDQTIEWVKSNLPNDRKR